MKTSKRTKLLSLLLAVAMMLTMTPIMAFTSNAGVETKNYKLVLTALNGYKNEVNDTNHLTVDELTTLGITASGTAESGYVYEFNNVNFETTAYCAIEFNNNATINLVGENTVKVGNSTNYNTFGIYAKKLTIQGEGSLTVVSGNTTMNFSYGIQCRNIIINSGKLTITAGNSAKYSYGISCDESFRMTKGNADIKSGDAVGKSFGVYYWDSLTMIGGTLNCVSGTASQSGTSAAVYSKHEADAKLVDPDDGTVLSYAPTNYVYKKGTDIATKATLTAMPCEYNSTKYVSIAKALEAIGTGTEDEHKTGTIKLLDNVKEDVTIGEFQEIILDLNGYKLENDKYYTITNKGKLSVIDLSTDKTGEIFSNTTAINNVQTGDLTVTDVKIIANGTGSTSGICNNKGVATINGNKTEITVTGTKQHIALLNTGGTITVNAGKFTASGSGIYNFAFATTNNNVTIGKDAEFILGNSTATEQAAYRSNVDNTISAGKFSGPIVAYGTSKITVTGGSFTENPTDMVNSDTHKVVDNGNTVAYRYTVKEKADTTISAPTIVTKKYDCTALYGTASPAVTTGSTVTYQTKYTADGQYSSESANVPSATDAGTIYVKAISRHADYKTVSVEYTLTVTRRDITFTSASDSKLADGTPLTNDTITVGGDGFAGEDGATYNVTGSQTEIGSSENTFTVDFNINTKAGNYNVTRNFGTLTVTEPYKVLFEQKKQNAITELEEFGNGHGNPLSKHIVKKGVKLISELTYDESKSYDENCGSIDTYKKNAIDNVTLLHNIVYNCPFLGFFARHLQPLFSILEKLY